jgi:hypothetical protein
MSSATVNAAENLNKEAFNRSFLRQILILWG